MINIRQKGANGEREVADALNAIVRKVMQEIGFSQQDIEDKARAVQRNQNQSAVGGCDLSNTFGMAIEIKRQEQLAVNSWWDQCVKAATRNGDHPVLLYRQNRKPWRVVTNVWLNLPDGKQIPVRAEFDWDSFLGWFRHWVYFHLMNGAQVRS